MTLLTCYSVSLHSEDAKKQMQRYCIGRIEGRWKNFTPPIQGGRFRPYIENATETDSLERIGTIHTHIDASRSPSPIFDTYGTGANSNDMLSSTSSASSVFELDDGMSYFNALTKEQIDLDHAKYPSLDLDTQETVVRKYRELDQRLRAEGLYDCNYSAYAVEACRYTFLAGMSFMFLQWGWYATSGLFLGCLWHQLVFTVHDAGHMGITHDFTIDTTIGILLADFIGGLSVMWWKLNHNVHHVVTNSPEHDPDIEHVPIFAISTDFSNH